MTHNSKDYFTQTLGLIKILLNIINDNTTIEVYRKIHKPDTTKHVYQLAFIFFTQ